MFYFVMLYMLAAGHAIVDFSLQNEFMAKFKNRHEKCPFIPGTIWPWILNAHVLPHGAAVMLVTGNFWLGILEYVVHTAIDYSKCNHRFGFHTDQILHYSCKVVYVLLIWFGLASSLWLDIYTHLIPLLNR